MTVPAAEHGQCRICRLADAGIGYAPQAKRRLRLNEMVFVCSDHIGLASKVSHMKPSIVTRIEEEALCDGAEAAGGYLDRIGKSDLATLTIEEYRTMFAVFLEAFGKGVAGRIDAHTAPF